MSGPASWEASGGPIVFSESFYLDGKVIEAGTLPPINVSREPGSVLVPMLSQTDVRQLFWLGGNMPVNLRGPMTFSLRVQFASNNDDYRVIQEAADFGVPVDVWFDYPITDIWWIPGQPSGTLWKTARKLPYTQVPNVNTTTRPPKAYLVTPAGVESEQTIVGSGTPTTGEVKVENTNGYYEIETPALTADVYSYLKLLYHPIILATIESFEVSYEQFNNLVFDLELQEHRGGLYTPA